jgi:ferric-dicitrate binding protein FerR (iron transport regulator)
MEKQRLTYLLQQHLSNAAIAAEQQELANMLQADTGRELFNTVLAEMMQQSPPALPLQPAVWQKMVSDIVQLDKTPAAPVRKSGSVFSFYRWAAAAVILLLAGTGVFYFMRYTPTNKTGSTNYKMISTARGQTQEVVLPDGSHVWLNAASTLRFPASFSAGERLVELTGEAFFDVEHADKIPFRIQSGDITTSVLGTAFDINAYPGQKALFVTVKRGLVKVQTGNTVLATLQKGEQVKITGNANAHLSKVDTLSIAGWLEGDLYYKDEVLADIIADLQRVFNAPIQINNASLNEERTTVSFNKDIGIQKALEIICRITGSRLSEKNGVYIIE